MKVSHATPRHAVLLLLSALSASCAPARTPGVTADIAPVPQAAPAPAASAGAIPNDVKWSRVSAEHRAIYLETYRTAAAQLIRLASGRPSGSWGVILDADETVLDNSEYERRRIPFGGVYDARIWNAWAMEGRAPALPGAVAYTSRVHELGGRVVIVSNREDSLCPVTRTNLERVSIRADLVLCMTTTGDKNPRFDAVENGTAASGFPAIAVLEWIGDNIEDFPHLTQAIRDRPDSALGAFGETFFALPNAMYGSWQSNPFM